MKEEQPNDDDFESMGVTREQFVALLQYSAHDGDAEAQFLWGKELMRGDLVRKDEKEALHWFLAAARQGHAEAQFRAGYALFLGVSCEVDEDAASSWMLKAAEQAVPNAQFFVGLMCLAAISGWTRDVKTARQWFSLAAQNGYPPAVKMLEALDGAEPMSVAQWRGVIDEQREPYLGNAVELFNDGMSAYFRKGDGDEALCVEKFRQAAALGHAKAQMMLGIYLREGIGCVANEKEYLMWLEKAAKQGLLQAQEELGYFYSHKEPDFSRAYHWFVRAAAQGSAPDLYDLGYYWTLGSFGKVDYTAAAEYFAKSAELGHWQAMAALSLMYECGKGCDRNAMRSIELTNQAAKLTDAGTLTKYISRFSRIITPERWSGVEPES